MKNKDDEVEIRIVNPESNPKRRKKRRGKKKAKKKSRKRRNPEAEENPRRRKKRKTKKKAKRKTKRPVAKRKRASRKAKAGCVLGKRSARKQGRRGGKSTKKACKTTMSKSTAGRVLRKNPEASYSRIISGWLKGV